MIILKIRVNRNRVIVRGDNLENHQFTKKVSNTWSGLCEPSYALSSFVHIILKNFNEMIEIIRPTSADSPMVFRSVCLINLGLRVSFTVSLYEMYQVEHVCLLEFWNFMLGRPFSKWSFQVYSDFMSYNLVNSHLILEGDTKLRNVCKY